MMMNGANLRMQAWDMRRWLVETRRTLHRHPEPGLEERRTATFIESRLTEMGVEYTRTGTAIVGILKGRHPGATVAMRADIDALPIHEKTGADYASATEGMMHACGHDAHTAILLGIARWFSEQDGNFPGTMKFLFQPAEETVGGAETMIRDGCLENPHVDFVTGLHVMPYLPVGLMETRKGALNGSSTMLDFTVRGKSCHAATPEDGLDAVVMAAQLVTALQAVVARYVSPMENAVLTIGSIHGGTARNIIVDEVRMEGTLRTTSDAVRDVLLERIRGLTEGLPASFGGSGELSITYGYKALINDPELVDLVAETAIDVLGPESVTWKQHPSMGVEDFAYFTAARPGVFYHLGCGNTRKGISSPLHTPTFDIDEDCLPLGVAMQIALALCLSGKEPRS